MRRDYACNVAKYFKADVPLSVQESPEWKARVTVGLKGVQSKAFMSGFEASRQGRRPLLERRALLGCASFLLDNDVGADVLHAASQEERDFPQKISHIQGRREISRRPPYIVSELQVPCV